MQKTMLVGGLLCLAALAGFSEGMCVKVEPVRPQTKMVLFNGHDFQGWTKVIKNEAGACPDKTWRVEEGVIKCAGTPFGYLRTQQVYADYQLHVEYRWADTTTKAPNSGVFVFTTGPDDHFLPKAIEAQLKSGSAGDWVLLSKATLNGVENPGNKSVKRQGQDSEKERGAWNCVDVTVKGNTVDVRVNGVVQNTGKDVYTDAGQICLQSEGGAIDFRNVYIEPLK